jgi:hypothetical protein
VEAINPIRHRPHPRPLSNMSLSLLAGGVAGASLYGVLGWECPMRMIGLACPGCGCGRTASLLVSEGIWPAFRQQPTAFVLLSTLVLIAIVGRFKVASNRKHLRSSMAYSLPIVFAVNFSYQVGSSVLS